MNRGELLKILSMRKAYKILKQRQKQTIKQIPDIKERARRLRTVREDSVGNYNLRNYNLNL